jgi:site-specific DNA-methyltransferase (adenine-specific)
MINKLYNDDCFNIFNQINKKSINMILVDLPYGQVDCNWDKKINLDDMWIQLKEICADNCQYIFFTTTKYGFELINSYPSWFKYDIVWEKPNAVGHLNSKKMPLRAHEMIYVFNNPNISKTSNRKRTYNPQMIEGKKYSIKREGSCELYANNKRISSINEGTRYPRSVINFHSSRYKSIHPTQKPIELCEWLIKTYSNENDIVLDFCMGSGSSIVACINTNRRYIGIEKDIDYYDSAVKRISEIDLLNIAK